MQRGAAILLKMWRVVRWPLLIAVIGYAGLVIYFMVQLPKMEAAAIEKINSAKLTLRDVDGSNLPPEPDPKLVDATVEGIDANDNNIRDDVELAIFKKYPNDIKVRAAELQYAMSQQLFLTNTIGPDSWKAAAVQMDRGYQCIGGTSSRDNLKMHGTITDQRVREVHDLQYNNERRAEARERAGKYATSYGTASSGYCDLHVDR